jgi:hypothetical protein
MSTPSHPCSCKIASAEHILHHINTNKTNSVAFSPQANYLTERPPLVDEI